MKTAAELAYDWRIITDLALYVHGKADLQYNTYLMWTQVDRILNPIPTWIPPELS